MLGDYTVRIAYEKYLFFSFLPRSVTPFALRFFNGCAVLLCSYTENEEPVAACSQLLFLNVMERQVRPAYAYFHSHHIYERPAHGDGQIHKQPLYSFFFKYTNSVNDLIRQLFALLSVSLNTPKFDVLLPVGISFYTFQAMSYTMDGKRSTIPHGEEIKSGFRIGFLT